jgi:putative ABC transport system permease protein
MIAWQYAARELRGRPGRWLLSLFSVVGAVAAIVAVTTATATTRQAYHQVFETLAGRADLEVVARGGGHFDAHLADRVRSLPDVRTVVPVLHRGTIIYAHGKKAKAMAVGIVPTEAESRTGFQVVKGRLPASGSEIALESSVAAGLQISVDDRVRLLTSRGLRTHQVVGLINPESAVRLRQGGMVLAPLDQLQHDFRSSGQIDALQVFLMPGASGADSMAAAARLLPGGLKVQVPSSRSGLAEETLLLTEVSLKMASALSFTTAVFIVLSVFLMYVGERRRQLSILRAVGATRRQIIGLICTEALLMGIGGTVLGIPVGVYGGSFLTQSMGALLQTNLPEAPDLRWALTVGALLGPVICLLASWYPARQASQVSPLEGMRPVVDLDGRGSHRLTTIVGIVGLLISGVLAIGSARGDIPIWAAVVGLIVSLVSFVLLMPVALGPVVKLLGYPLRWLLGLEGEMSERIVLRRVARSALTIGVLFVAVSAAVGTGNAVFSITDDVRTWYERTITADFLIRPMMPDVTGQEGASMSESLGQEIAALEGVEKVDAVRLVRIEANGPEAVLVSRNFSLYDRVPLDVIGGDPVALVDQLRGGATVVGSVLADKAKVRPGDTLHVTFGTESHDFRVAGIATEYSFGGAVAYIDRDVAKRLLKIEGVDTFLIKARGDALAALQPKLQAIAERDGLLLQSFAELLGLIDSMIAGVTGGLWVLLTLGLLVGALGVVNTLTMNVLEQTKELGMLRAIGMRHRQVVKTVLGQAAYLGIIGVVAGAVSGVSLARAFNVSLASTFGRYVPFAMRTTFLVALVLAGLAVVMLSALLPAWRAARLNAIQAMRSE